MAIPGLRTLTCCFATVTIACTPSDQAAYTLADSAGVPVVVNHTQAFAELPEWRLNTQPALQIGQSDGAEEYTLFRVMGATRLSDGGIVVANRGTQELRFYDQDGQHLRSVGGQGDGPEEFGFLSGVGRFSADSLLAFETLRRRTVSILSGSGVFRRRYLPSDEFTGYPLVWGVLANGGMVATPGDGVPAGDRPAYPILISTVDGQVQASLGEFPRMEVMSNGEPVLFGRDLHVHAFGGFIAVGNDDAFSIQVYRSTGELSHVVRLDEPPAPVTDAAVSQLREQALADATDEASRSYMEAYFNIAEVAPTFPAFGGLRLDQRGNLWVDPYEPPAVEPRPWLIFDPAGVLIATVTIPEELLVYEIGTDYVLGLTRDDLGIEQVRLYRLTSQ